MGGLQGVPKINLIETAQSVKVSKNLPPTSCEEVGILFSSVSAPGLYLEDMVKYIRIDLSNKAAQLGANYVVLEGLDNTNYKDDLIMAASATSYLCFVSNLKDRSPLLFSLEDEH